MECCPSLDWTLLVFDLLMVARSRAEGSNENLRYAQNRWVPEKWQIHTTQSWKSTLYCSHEQETDNASNLKVVDDFDYGMALEDELLGVVDRDIVYQFGRQVTKVWFYRQILGLFSWAGSPGPGRPGRVDKFSCSREQHAANSSIKAYCSQEQSCGCWYGYNAFMSLLLNLSDIIAFQKSRKAFIVWETNRTICSMNISSQFCWVVSNCQLLLVICIEIFNSQHTWFLT